MPVGNEYNLVLFVEFTEIILSTRDENGLCVYNIIKDMGWYLVVIGKLYNYECLIYIFTE